LVAFIINGAFHEAWPSVVTNVAWFVISAIALIRMRSARLPPTPPVVDVQQVQFPGAPETTESLDIVDPA
jgi:hypothetical protein